MRSHAKILLSEWNIGEKEIKNFGGEPRCAGFADDIDFGIGREELSHSLRWNLYKIIEFLTFNWLVLDLSVRYLPDHNYVEHIGIARNTKLIP